MLLYGISYDEIVMRIKLFAVASHRRGPALLPADQSVSWEESGGAAAEAAPPGHGKDH
jgi:hypothetical protein